LGYNIEENYGKGNYDSIAYRMIRKIRIRLNSKKRGK
jgi:hypothetical protein